jgi:hypothetical protein
MCLRDGLEDVEKRNLLTLQGFELRSVGRPASSQSLYRLRYPGSCYSVLLFLDKQRTISGKLSLKDVCSRI